MLSSLDMKAESSWAWSGEWVKVTRYESQSMKGVGLGIQQEVRKRAGLEVSLESQRSGLVLEFRGQRDKTVLYIKDVQKLHRLARQLASYVRYQLTQNLDQEHHHLKDPVMPLH